MNVGSSMPGAGFRERVVHCHMKKKHLAVPSASVASVHRERHNIESRVLTRRQHLNSWGIRKRAEPAWVRNLSTV